MLKLSELLHFAPITIQCHDSPDADSIASAFALRAYFEQCGKKAEIIYSGAAPISKPNLVKMAGLLSIPLEHVPEPREVGCLLVVDAQYGEKNVTRFPAGRVFQIDHHEDMQNGCPGIVNSGLGSCSTLAWLLLSDEGFDFGGHMGVSTALYYGLYSDTASFEEISHPHDRDMRDALGFDGSVFNYLRNNNLTIEDMRIAGAALTRFSFDRARGFAIFQAEACDANILGFISDLAVQVEGVDACVVHCPMPHGHKLSVRSCTRETMASDLAKAVAGGGGHRRKAGGFLPFDRLGGKSINTFLAESLREYAEKYDRIYCDSHGLNVPAMPRYKKRKIPQGCAPATAIFPAGTPMLVRTLEGDSHATASDDVMLMLNPEGEVYPMDARKFAASYAYTDAGFIKDFTYMPTAKNARTGETLSIAAFARGCVPTGESHVHAEPLSRHTKVFGKWTPDGYYLGEPGDYLAARSDDHGDVYIIKRNVFFSTYEHA